MLPSLLRGQGAGARGCPVLWNRNLSSFGQTRDRMERYRVGMMEVTTLAQMTRAELYGLAQAHDITGRSRMAKADLLAAVSEAIRQKPERRKKSKKAASDESSKSKKGGLKSKKSKEGKKDRSKKSKKGGSKKSKKSKKDGSKATSRKGKSKKRK